MWLSSSGMLLLLIVLLMLIVLLLVVLILGSKRREEFESDSVAAAIMSSDGTAILDKRCLVQSAEGPYTLPTFAGLMRHPTEPNTCYFRTVTGNGRIIATNECIAGSEIHDDGVVASMDNDSVLGSLRCVMKLKPGLPVTSYAAYDAALVEKSVERTDRFIALVQQITDKKGTMITESVDRDASTDGLVASTTRRRDAMANLISRYGDMEASLDSSTTAADEVAARGAAATAALAERSQWQGRAVAKTSEAARKKQELDAALADAAPGIEAQRIQYRASQQATLTSKQTDRLNVNPGQLSAQADSACAAQASARQEAREQANRRPCVRMWADQFVHIVGQPGNAPWGAVTTMPVGSAQWIWNTPNAARDVPTGATVLFQTELTTTGGSNQVTMYVVVDNSAVVYIDDRRLGTVENGWDWAGRATRFDMELQAGYSLVTIIATNAGGPAGLLASLYNRSTNQEVVTTGLKWRCTTNIRTPRCTASVANPWTCVPGFDAPMRLNEDGDTECMSTNNHDCMWGGSDCRSKLATPPYSIKPLACGEMHRREWGDGGYGIPTHWCYQVAKRLQ